MSSLVGKTVAERYSVLDELGGGGMATVYKVWDLKRTTHLAMKVLKADLAEDRVFLRRFRREAKTLSKLRHPNIVQFYGLDQAGELMFMLLGYVDGVTLSRLAHRIGRPFTPGQILAVLEPVCSALHYAHHYSEDEQIIHCDIKPANIMIDQTGNVLLTDFGIARLAEGAATATLVGAGTPAFMAPEQAAGEDPTFQTDIYALGVVLYVLATGGERPFTGDSATISGTVSEKIRWEHRHLSPPSPRKYNAEISPELETVILRCLAKKPKKRYDSVTGFLNDLRCAVGVDPEPLPISLLKPEWAVSTTSQSRAPALAEGPPPRKRPWLWLTAAGVLVVGVALLAVTGAALILGRGALARGSGGANPNLPPAQVASGPTESLQPGSVPVVPPTFTSFPSTPTAIPPTNTPAPTPIPDLSISHTRESDGVYLMIQGGPEDYDIRVGALPQGSYILGPNDKFAAYLDNSGNLYVVPFNTGKLKRVERLLRKDWPILGLGEEPRWELSWYTHDTGTYSLQIREAVTGQKGSLQISRSFTHW